MNGSRPAPPRHGDRSSLDALNRTIEGLEARIQGLMAGAGRAAKPERAVSEPLSRPPHPAAASRPAAETYRDPLAEIRERQRALEQATQNARHAERDRLSDRDQFAERSRPDGRYQPAPSRAAERRPAQLPETLSSAAEAYPTPSRREENLRPAVAARLAEANHRRPENGGQQFTDAFASFRQELKRDISEGVSREMRVLRDEVRAIKAQAEDRNFNPDIQSDLARLAQGIDQLTMHATPESASLRADLEELRAVMEGLAREDSIRQMQEQWAGLEERIHETDASVLREEIVTLAYRIDEIRDQLGLMADSPVIRTLEQKLLALAGMMEQLGSRIKPDDATLTKQFGQLDNRLDEISRAIAASASNAVSSSQNELAMQRLESRLSALMENVQTIGRTTSDTAATDGLSLRIELLAGKIEELAEDQAAARLEERIEQLSDMVQQLQAPGQQDEFVDHLSAISRKIDALDTSFTSEGLGERLDYLARRIEEMEQPRPAAAGDDKAFGRIEDRLSDIAARLDEASATPSGNDEALRGLEAQIAHLSTLIAQPSSGAAPAFPPEFDNRMAAIEGYMATNDEYIVEAARQAAEAVVEAYSRNIGAGSPSSGTDMAALAALADDLKQLEDLTRNSDNRAHQTFEKLHGTLVQIADRLDSLEHQVGHGATAPYRAEEPLRQPAFATAAAYPREMAATASAAVAAPAAEPAGIDMPRSEARRRETSAIGSTLSEHLPPAAEETFEEEAKPAKTSLLGGLARRFRPSAKPETAPVARTVVEPTPSIDPSDVLPPERENDLLEPGSGAPDVKKILERVRASQAAGEFDRERANERADYIAAARRAAKAAAQEADPSQMGSMPKAQAKTGKAKDPAAKGGSAGSAFSRHRRPIMMAVGAVLLALMAMPLIKTVTGSQKTAQVASVASTARPPAEIAAGETGDATAPGAAQTTPAPSVSLPATTDLPEASSLPEELSTDPAAADMDSATTDGPMPGETLPGTAQPEAAAQDTTAPEPNAQDLNAQDLNAQEPGTPDIAASQPMAEAPADLRSAMAPAEAPVAGVPEQAAEAITVPAGIQPKSLADAASAGDANALFEIGARFSDGRGVKADLAEASKWYRLAADRGLPPAQYRMGNLLEKGTGVERNIGEAVSYYRSAAEAGNASAMHNLAVLYASGAAGQPDYAAAVEWFGKAADLGVADSQFNLAILYARGNGVRQDLEESFKWFGVAAKNGDKDAAEKRDEVANAMRKDQLDGARAKLDAWQAKPLDPRANTVNLPDEWASGKAVTTASVDMTKAIRNIQAILNKNGFDAGSADGKMGAKTVAAIKAFQTSIGQEPTGKVNDALVRELLARNG